MKVTITTIGSRGDVQPYLALGAGLKAAGHEVTVVTPEIFKAAVVAAGLKCVVSTLDPVSAVKEQLGVGSANILEFLVRSRRILTPIMEDNLKACIEGSREADAIIFSPTESFGYQVARGRGIPSVAAILGPLLGENSSFPSAWFPPIRDKLTVPATTLWERVVNRLSYPLTQQVCFQAVRGPTNRALRRNGAYGTFPFAGPFRQARKERTPILAGWSPSVLPQPEEWGDHQRVCGYWYLEDDDVWSPPPELAKFLDAGPPPVCVGFGSMSARNPGSLLRLLARSFKIAGVRGLVLTGWSEAGKPDALGKDLHVTPEAPHGWLFPRVAATVHHGGAGTTAAGLRSGVPAVVVSHFADQPFWGARLAGLGCAPLPIPRKSLTADNLARAVVTATSDGRMRHRAKEIGERIRSENGVGRAVEEFERQVAGPK